MFMSYDTRVVGEVFLKDEGAISTVQRLLDRGKLPFEEVQYADVESESGRISVEGHLNNRAGKIEMLSVFLTKIDTTARGIIRCAGDDWDDHWKIEVSDGHAMVKAGEVVYRAGVRFTDKRIEQLAHEIREGKLSQ